MRRSVAVSMIWSILFTILLTGICCILAHPILHWMQTPDQIYDMAYEYMFAILLGTGATVFYNMISNILRALGDSRTPLYFLIFSSEHCAGSRVYSEFPYGRGRSRLGDSAVTAALCGPVYDLRRKKI